MTDSEFERLAELLHEKLDQKLASAMTGLNGRFDGLEMRFDGLEERVRKNGVTIEHVRDEVKIVAERVTGVVEEIAAMQGRLSDRIEGVSQEVQTLAGHIWPPIEDYEKRIRALEG